MPSPNRLSREKSPYLLQHANNPVDWYPWGEEAFAKAREEDKPIFLSIGYSTCHWCHVMERESFESEEVAKVLNEHYVPVKVDREERPDVDRIYMLFVQATTGSGGWPMSVFLTPDLRPFYGGTYFPPDNRYGRPGFRTLLEHLATAWKQDRPRIEEAGSQVVGQLRQYASLPDRRPQLDPQVLDHAFLQFRRSFDKQYGGFGGAPKFPRMVTHNFLLRYYATTRNEEALDMVLATLREMARGGINDQLGGGFHRYAVDEKWFVPHFEKMLYDQAQIAQSYLEAYQLTGDDAMASTARTILDYVLRDLTHPEGGFYSAEDADSVLDPANPHEKGEGAFYIWSHQELSRLLDPKVLKWFCYRYGVELGGNIAHDPHGEFTGRNILAEVWSLEDTARRFGASPTEVEAAFERAREVLLEARSRRIRPHLDDKILTAWNGLMISAFAKGAQILREERYADAAVRAAQFLLKRLYQPENAELLRRFRDGESAIPGFLDDYAYFIQALLDLYEATFEIYYLDLAVQLAGRMRDLFEDREAGGFFSTREGAGDLVLRMKEDYDGAEPSGNSIAAQALLKLAAITDREDLETSAERAVDAFSSRLAQSATGVPQMLCVYMQQLLPPRQVVIAGHRDANSTQAMVALAQRTFQPNAAVLLADPELARYSPAYAGMTPVDGEPAAYVCENFSCKLPVTDVEELAEMLRGVARQD
ncbi:MAG: thioredoxin domain-containing protein [Bryobacteraceae bacterium]|nr:thioredoxin domain-containing protein [Bryobacteraceae bacterium]